MTLHQFNVTDEMQQAKAVERGTRIGERQDASHDILLYQIDDFYVEAYYCWKNNELVMFKSFSNPDLLQPYLRQINIDKLIGKMSRSRWGMFKRGTTVLLNNYRQFLGIKETIPDRVVFAQFVTILIFLFVVGLSIGHLLASL